MANATIHRRPRISGLIDSAPSPMPVPSLFSSHNEYNDQNYNSISWSQTVSNNENRILVVCCSFRGGIYATSVTYNSVACTLAVQRRTSDSCTQIWIMLESNLPVAGSYTVSVTCNDYQNKNCESMCWDNVRALGDWGTDNETNGSEPSLTLETETDDVCISTVGLQSTSTLTEDSNETLVIMSPYAAQTLGVLYKRATTTSTTVHWTCDSQVYTHVAVILKKPFRLATKIHVVSLTKGTINNVSSTQWTHMTTNEHTDLMLLLLIGYGGYGEIDDSTIAYHSDIMTKIGSTYTDGNNAFACAYRLMNPDIGSYDFYLNNTYGNMWGAYVALLLCGVNQTTMPTADGNGGSAQGSISVGFTLAEEDAMFGVVGYWDNGEYLVPNSGQTELVNYNVDGSWRAMGHWKKGVGAQTIGYTNQNHEYALAGVKVVCN